MRLGRLIAAALLAAMSGATATLAAEPLQKVAILRGTCTALTVTTYDWARACSPVLTNEVYRSGRVAFTFALRPGSTVTFSGIADQIKQGPDVAIQPVDRVIWKFDVGVAPHVLPAVGKCRYTNPYVGRATVTCDAAASDGAYKGAFTTDGSPPSAREY